jgi:tetratricopeptide (TPR) repeat protein
MSQVSLKGMTRSVRRAVLGVVLATAFGAGAAHAQACAETEFTSATGQAYLDAESQLTQSNNAAEAARLGEALLTRQLNCYERGAVLKLLAASYLRAGQNVRAAQMLEQALSAGAITAADRPQTLINIAQIYLQAQDIPTADRFFTQWLQAGGRPNRDHNWQLAVIKHKLNNNRAAIPFAEAVLAADGATPRTEVVDFLIFLYDNTGDAAKKAALLERKLVADPQNKQTWEAIAGDFFRAGDERSAFEVTKAMYHAGLLRTDDELMRIVNFYNRFDAPFQAARVLEREMNAGRITRNLERIELLAQLYQVAREYERAIPVLQQAAEMSGRVEFLERAGRSFFELGRYREAIDILGRATQRSGMREPAFSRVLIGQAKYELGDKPGAREAFTAATQQSGDANGTRAARAWLDFMRSEDDTRAALVRFNHSVKVEELTRRLDFCKRGDILRQEGQTGGENCDALAAELEQLKATTPA